MEKYNSYSVKLKLDRNKINYEISNDKHSITLGKANIGMVHLMFNIILPLTLALIVLILTAAGIIPYIKRITGFVFFGMPFTFGILGIIMFIKKKKNNKGIKIISKGLVKIVSENNEHIIKSETIKCLEYHIDEKEELKQGLLYLIETNGTKHLLLGVTEHDKVLLENDMNYFINYFNKLIGI